MRFTLVALTAALTLVYAGCSEPVPQTPDGAFFFATIQDNPLECGIVGHTAQVGAVDQNEKKSVVVDGTNNTKVDCSVIGANGSAPFEVHAKLDDTQNSGNYLEIYIPKVAPGATKDAPAAGSAVISTPRTATTYTGNCNFYFEAGTKETVANGRIWVSFDCPKLTSSMSSCPLKQGFAIFENCLTESTGDEE